jgi:hypothetical protein
VSSARADLCQPQRQSTTPGPFSSLPPAVRRLDAPTLRLRTSRACQPECFRQREVALRHPDRWLDEWRRLAPSTVSAARAPAWRFLTGALCAVPRLVAGRRPSNLSFQPRARSAVFGAPQPRSVSGNFHRAVALVLVAVDCEVLLCRAIKQRPSWPSSRSRAALVDLYLCHQYGGYSKDNLPGPVLPPI